MAKSHLETQFLLLYKSLYKNVPKPVREYRFDDTRRFRFDFAWIKEKVAVEIQGGVWGRGGHSTGVGLNRDCDKSNLATANGWKVFKFTTNHLREKPKESLELVYNALELKNYS